MTEPLRLSTVLPKVNPVLDFDGLTSIICDGLGLVGSIILEGAGGEKMAGENVDCCTSPVTLGDNVAFLDAELEPALDRRRPSLPKKEL